MIARRTRLLAVPALVALAVSTTGCTIPGGAKATRSAVPAPSTVAAPAPTTTTTTTATATPEQTAPVAPAPSTLDQATQTPTPTATTPPETPTGSDSPAPTLTASSTPTVSDTPSPSATPSVPESATAAPAPATSPAVPTPTAPAGVATPITVGAGETRHLTITDVAANTGWAQQPAQPAGSTGWIYALAAPVSCQAQPATLSFAFERADGTLHLGFAQAADSASSAEKLEVAVSVDGRSAARRSVPFTGTAELTVPLQHASTVQVTVSDPSPCSGTATALITSARVQG